MTRQQLMDSVPDPRTTPALTIDEVAKLFRIGRSLAYEKAARNELGVPVLRIGTLYRVPTAAVLALLGLDGDSAGAA